MEKRRISFGELRLGQTARNHINDCLDKNWITMGEKTELFEQQWGELFDYPYNIFTSSGTDALIASFSSLYEYGAVPQKSEIITPALSFISTANAIRASNLIPRFCDIKKETLNIDEDKIEECINENTVAICVVHTMGRPCEMDKITSIAKNYNLKIIEDACESHSAKYKGGYIGSFGDIACFSFYTAHLCVCGEGGMISCSDEGLYKYLYSVRNHGRSGVYFDFSRYGLNHKNTDIAASIGLEGLEEFWVNYNKRYNNMKYLRQELDRFSDIVWFSEEDTGNTNCPHGFSLTFKKEGQIHKLQQSLDEANIEWKRNFGDIPQHGAFRYLNLPQGSFPNSEFVGNNGLHVGVHQYLTQDDLDYMVYHISKTLEQC